MALSEMLNAIPAIQTLTDIALSLNNYVRLLDSTDPGTVLQLMCNHWCLTEPDTPSLVVSVAAGGDLYCLSDTQTRDIFNRGLVKAIRATNGWLITSGLNSGVAKAVGAAVQEGQSLAWKNSSDLRLATSLHCIGIATWNQVQHREILTNTSTDVLNTAEYYVDQVAREGIEEPLNPNHSHFLLVDTGVSSDGYASMGTAEFRAALEHQIAAPRDEGGLDVPVVCLLVEGNMTSLEQLLNSVRQGLPAVVCENSGRAAELIGWTVKQYSKLKNQSDELHRQQEEYQLRVFVIDKAKQLDTEGRLSEPYYEQIADMVLEICTYKDQITLFQIGPNSSLDEALLLSILDSQHKRNPWKQLELAQRWNRADVASRILSDPKFSILATRKNVCKLMIKLTESIVDNQPDFVKLYIDSGIPMKEYLTAGTLCEIYKKTVKAAPYLWSRLELTPKGNHDSSLKRKDTLFEVIQVKKMTLENVNMLIHSFGRRFTQPEYQDSNYRTNPSHRQFNCPLQELFYWAVMFNRKLEDLAVGLTNEAFKQNINKASLMIQRTSCVWGRLSCMQLAGLVSNQRFLATECCQYAIKKDWKRGFTASTWKILFSMITFFPVVFCISFEKELPKHCRCPPEQADREPLKFRVKRWSKQMFTFYYSPVVKFIHHTMWYTIYLLLYAYVLLFSIGHLGDVDKIKPAEYLLYFWQLTFICEEIRTILWQPRETLRDKLLDYWVYNTLQSWNRLHMIGYSFSVVIIIMRFSSRRLFVITKMFLIINFVLYVMRIFKVYFINGYLGPKVVMINRMTRDLMMFALVFSIFMISFSITYHSLFHAKDHFDSGMITDILSYGIWEVFGEVNTEYQNETFAYCVNQTDYYTTECLLNKHLMTAVLAIYLFFSNILLVNMLIATFTHIFEDIHKNSEQIWMFELYFLIDEFLTKPLLPEPFIILEHMFLLIRSFVHRCKNSKIRINTEEVIWGKVLSKPERHFLSVFESVCRGDFVENRMKRCFCTCGHCCKCGSGPYSEKKYKKASSQQNFD